MRILTGFIWDGKSGGIDAYLMAFSRVARDESVQLDFLTNEYCDDLAAELNAMGHRLFEIATLRNRVSQKRTIRLLCEQNSYDAAYFNISTALMYPVVKDALDAGVPKIAVHSHATGSNQSSRTKELLFDLLNYAMRGKLRRCATHRFACSRLAALWLFGDECESAGNVAFVPNPIDVHKFAYNPRGRAAIRRDLGLEGKLVVGSVTAMKTVKNPWLLIDMFAEFCKTCPRAHLLVVGDGAFMAEVEKHAACVLEGGSYRLLGKRDNIPELLQAFDAFVLPSKKEGMPISVLEAQAAGLPCLLSEGVPEEVIVEGPIAKRVRVNAPAKEWAAELASLLLRSNAAPRRSFDEEVASAGFDASSPRLVLDRLRG